MSSDDSALSKYSASSNSDEVGGHFSEILEATESASANLMKPSSIQSRYTVPDPNAGGASKKKSSLAASISSSSQQTVSIDHAAAAASSTFGRQLNSASSDLIDAISNSSLAHRLDNQNQVDDGIELSFDEAEPERDIFGLPSKLKTLFQSNKQKVEQAPPKTKEEEEEDAKLAESIERMRRQQVERARLNDDEFNSEFTETGADALANPSTSSSSTSAEAAVSASAATKPERKRLKPSSRQSAVETQRQEEEKRKKAEEEEQKRKAEEEAKEKRRLEEEEEKKRRAEKDSKLPKKEEIVVLGKGVQVAALANILPPTHILDKYMYSNTNTTTISSSATDDEFPTQISSTAPTAAASSESNSSESDSKVEVTVSSVMMATNASSATANVSTSKEAQLADEWNQVQEFREKQLSKEGESALAAASQHQNLISYEDAIKFFASYQYNDKQREFVRYDFSRVGCWLSLRYSLFGNPTLPPHLELERDLFFSVARVQMDYDVPHMERILQNVYRSLTGDKLPCRRFGSHWEDLGFQGSDPATDLRGSGMLGLLQLLYFVKYYQELALKLFRFSRSRDTQDENFPFALISFKMTGIAIQVLRECKLYDTFVQANSVTIVMHNLYLSLFYDFYLTCKHERLTIMQFESYINNQLSTKARADPTVLITAFQANNQPIRSEIEDGLAEFGAVPDKK